MHPEGHKLLRFLDEAASACLGTLTRTEQHRPIVRCDLNGDDHNAHAVGRCMHGGLVTLLELYSSCLEQQIAHMLDKLSPPTAAQGLPAAPRRWRKRCCHPRL